MQPLAAMLEPQGEPTGCRCCCCPATTTAAAPSRSWSAPSSLGGTTRSGTARVIFRAKPAIVSRTGRDGTTVQFLLLPWPRPQAYLDGSEPLMAGPGLARPPGARSGAPR